MKNKKRIILTVLLALVCPVRGSNVSEYVVKADYLTDFAGSVKWPEKVFDAPTSPIVLGVLGEDPFGPALDAAVQGKTEDGRPLAVKRFGNFEADKLPEMKNCQILFISDSEKDDVREILASLKGSNLLTVSEIDQFPRMGGMIQFDQEGDFIGLVVNPKTAHLADLKFSPQLLRVAKLYVQVNAAKAKALYFKGVNLYINGEIKGAIAAWKACLEEDPNNRTARAEISKAQSKLDALSEIR